MGFSSFDQLAARLLCLAAFHAILSRGQGPVTSNVCLKANGTVCTRHRLSCPGESDLIVLLSAREGFYDLEGTPDPQGCQSDSCTEVCCRPSSFPCTRASSDDHFALLYSDCWGKTSCTPDAALGPGDNDSNSGPDCNSTKGLSSISYQCMQESSFNAFWNNDTVEGRTVVAQFSRYLQGWEATQDCRFPSNTLQCDVTSSSDVGAIDVTVMLIMHHSFGRPRSCSALQFQAGNVTSAEHPCQGPLEHASRTVELPANSSLRIVFSVLNQALPFQAWALVQAETSNLTMTCGLGTCSVEKDVSLTPISSSTTPAELTHIPCSCPSNNTRRVEDTLYFSIIIALGVLCIFLMVTQAITLLLLVRRRRAAHDQIYALTSEHSQDADAGQAGSIPVASDSGVSSGQVHLDDVSLTEESPGLTIVTSTKL